MGVRTIQLAVFVASLGLGACAGEDDIASNDDNYVTDAEADLSAELTEKYGTRPRRYNGLFNGSNEAEERFLSHLPLVTEEMNAIIAHNGYDFTVTEAELATNFISEGGFYLLDDNITDTNVDEEIYISGFHHLGIDTFVDNIDALEPWMTWGLATAWNEGKLYTFDAENELGQTYTQLVVDTIEHGMEANAIVFTWSRAVLADDLEDRNLSLAELPYEAKFYWSTMYFNAGIGFGADRIDENGIDYWREKWTSPDDPAKYSGYAKYNALWRTASYEFMDITVFDADR